MSPNVPASVKARLLNGARARHEEFQRTLVRYAAERLIYRIGASRVRGRFVLKGAGLLVVWLHDPHRATRDVDVLAFGASDEAAVRALVEEICAVSCPEDGVSFAAGRATPRPRAELQKRCCSATADPSRRNCRTDVAQPEVTLFSPK